MTIKQLFLTFIFILSLSGFFRFIRALIIYNKKYRKVLNIQNSLYKKRKSIINNTHIQDECPICFREGDFFFIACGHVLCPRCYRRNNKCPICTVSNNYVNKRTPYHIKINWGYLILKLNYIEKCFPDFVWDKDKFLDYKYEYPYDMVKYSPNI